MLDQIEQERDGERRKAFFEASEQRADYRTAALMAHLHNTSGFAEEAREPKDYFACFPSLRDLAEEAKPREMDTAQTVSYLKAGFGLIVPTAFRQKVGLPD